MAGVDSVTIEAMKATCWVAAVVAAGRLTAQSPGAVPPAFGTA